MKSNLAWCLEPYWNPDVTPAAPPPRKPSKIELEAGSATPRKQPRIGRPMTPEERRAHHAAQQRKYTSRKSA